MHFFGGLTHQECADVLGVSARTVARYWEFAQAWLSRELTA
jgi:DNA-directed RNA polymerase specialized sigma24 family protein